MVQALIREQWLPCNCWSESLGENHADDLSTSANAQTLFLRLPREIKNRIYELVLGGNMLHIRRELLKFKRNVIRSTKGFIKEQRFTNHICRSQISEEDAQHRFDTEEGRNPYVKDIELRHSLCAPSKPNGGAFAPLRMDINLLHACRQIYNEARFIPYSTNMFSFDTSRILRAFVHLLVQRGVNVNSAIRSLHIDSNTASHDLRGWTQAFNAVTQHMTLLETIYLNVDQPVAPLRWNIGAGAENIEKSLKPVADCLAVLGKTPAKSISIIVSDRFRANSSSMDFMWAPTPWILQPWTVKEKRLWAEQVKLVLHDVHFSG